MGTYLLRWVPTFLDGYLPSSQGTYLLHRVPTFFTGYLPSSQGTYLLHRVPTFFTGYLPMLGTYHLRWVPTSANWSKLFVVLNLVLGFEKCFKLLQRDKNLKSHVGCCFGESVTKFWDILWHLGLFLQPLYWAKFRIYLGWFKKFTGQFFNCYKWP